jgi:hypothetical protein
MKPWFVKEADIIKFPTPKAKVVDMPNVQSYPDFLTGVKDLQNRKAQGEISQDSHDRLYSDLINRFMKKESFETPWFLREAPTGTCNRGHALEFHLAVAIHERLKKVKFIGREELVQAILNHGRNINIRDKFSDKEDTFILQGSVTAPVIQCNTPENLAVGGVFDPNIKGALKFANSELDKQIKYIHNNGRKDKVIASTIGTAGNKVDLQVLVKYMKDGKEVTEPLDDLSMSLKFKSKEFGQTKISTKAGSLDKLKGTFTKQFTKMFTSIGFEKTFKTAGMPIIENMLKDPDYTKSWTAWRENYKKNPGRYDLKRKTGPEGSEKVLVVNDVARKYMTELYKKITPYMNATFKGKNGELKEKEVIGNFLLNELAGGENLSVLSFSDKAYTKMPASQLNNLKKLLQSVEVRVEYGTASKEGSIDPYIFFFDQTNNELIFQIRNTIDGEHVIKNVYEQGPGLNKYKEKVLY